MGQIKNHQIENNTITGASLDSNIGIYDETKVYVVDEKVFWKATLYQCTIDVVPTIESDLTNAPDLSANWKLEDEIIPFDVTSLPSCVFNIDASENATFGTTGSLIDSWASIDNGVSATGTALTTNRPTLLSSILNGLDVVSFTGTTELTYGDVQLQNTGLHVFALCKRISGSTSGTIIGKYQTTSNREWIMRTDRMYTYEVPTSTTSDYASLITPNNQWVLREMRVSFGEQVNALENGQYKATSGGICTGIGNSLSDLMVGDTQSSNNFTGQIAQIVVFSEKLSEANATLVRDEFQRKWGIGTQNVYNVTSGDWIWRGLWSPGSYLMNEVVRYNGSSFVALQDTNEIPSIGLYWDAVALADRNFNWQSDWVSQNYIVDDVVKWTDDNLYVCIIDTTASQNPTNGTYWELYLEKGIQGLTGPSGNRTWQGTYVGTTTYVANDEVYYLGSSFVATASTTGTDPFVTDPEIPNSPWEITGMKGDDGAGATINVSDDGSTVSTTCGTLNFVDGLSAVGGAVVNINAIPRTNISYGFSSTQSITASWQKLNLDTVLISHVDFTNVLGTLTVNRNLNVFIDYSIMMELDSNDNSRNTIISEIRLNGTSLSYSQGAGYGRGVGYNPHVIANASGIYCSLNNTDFIELWYQADDDIQTPVVGIGQSWITIREI